MAKIAIYDTFYQSVEYPAADIAGQALAGSEHRVIGTATNIRQAAQQILDFAHVEPAERPDVIIMVGMLEGELEYQRQPLTMVEPTKVRQRTWWGGAKEEDGKHTTFLLPQFDQDGKTYHFPSVVLIGNASDHPPDKLFRQWNLAVRSGIAACVLSRIAETYLPETKRLGISSDPMFDAVLSAREVNRSNPDVVEALRSRLQAVTGSM